MPAQEQWKAIPGFPDYQVSSLGRVVSHRRGQAYEMKGGYNERGYRMVNVRSQDGRIFCRTVHRLMALAFLGEPPAGMEVRHLDGTKRNDLDNIEYATKSVNMQDQVTHGVHIHARKTHCPRRHEYTPENTRLYRGRRFCRACGPARRAEQQLRAAGVKSVAA